MSPEELEAARIKWNRIDGRTVTLVNEVTLRIDRLNFDAMSTIPKLLDHIDTQASQIARLKEALIEETARANYPLNWSVLSDEKKAVWMGNSLLELKSGPLADIFQEDS
jgi:hypothetical protein